MNQKQNYIISRHIRETHNVVILDLKPEEGEVFSFHPGQFVMLHLNNHDGTQWRKLPYSICSSPLEKKHIQLCFKIYGEFTQRMAKLEEGEVVEISGPYGRFTFHENPMESVVMLAGGIGITPFMSMLRYVTVKNLPNSMLLLYGNQTPHDIAFRNELYELETKNKNISVVYTVDQAAPGWRGETGFINVSMLEKYCSPLNGKYFFLCGPMAFVETMKKILLACRINKDYVIIEKF